MKYMTLYVEIRVADGSTDDELREATTRALSRARLDLNGEIVGEIVHTQVTEGPTPLRQTGGPR